LIKFSIWPTSASATAALIAFVGGAPIHNAIASSDWVPNPYLCGKKEEEEEAESERVSERASERASE
jgi:hypothetical protein